MTAERTWAEVDNYFARLLLPEIRCSTMRWRPAPPPACRPQVSATAGQAAVPARHDAAAPGASSRSARSAATARSGSRGRCRRRPARHPGSRPAPRRGRARELRARRAGRAGRGARRPARSTRCPARSRGRRRSTSSSSTPTRPATPTTSQWALRLTRPGSVIVADNVVRGGAVLDAASDRPERRRASAASRAARRRAARQRHRDPDRRRARATTASRSPWCVAGRAAEPRGTR